MAPAPLLLEKYFRFALRWRDVKVNIAMKDLNWTPLSPLQWSKTVIALPRIQRYEDLPEEARAWRQLGVEDWWSKCKYHVPRY